MDTVSSIEDRIGRNYTDLSAKLKVAADFVLANPVDIATRSLRSVAQSSGVSPATYSRLARVLGYSDYEEMREIGRKAVGDSMTRFSDRAANLSESSRSLTAGGFLNRHAYACSGNIASMVLAITSERLEAAVDALHGANRVLLLGSMGSAALTEFLGYQTKWFSSNWIVIGRSSTPPPLVLADTSAQDAILVLVKSPYARLSIATLKLARERGLKTVVITDSHSSPALAFADHFFVVPSDSPNFFSSYVATLVLIETIASMLMTRGGPKAEQRIRETENTVSGLGEIWAN